MIERLDQWLRRVHASNGVIAVFLLGAVVAWIATPLFLLVVAILMFGPEAIADFMWMEPPFLHDGYATIIAVGYGIYRACFFHPLNYRSYGKWLAQTPWRYPEPLPLGPIGLVWQDAFLVGVMTLVAWVPPHENWRPLLVPGAFLFVYSTGLCFTHWSAGLRWPTYACLWIAGLAFLVAPNDWLILLVLAAYCAVATSPIRTVLSDFPYEEQRRVALKLLPYSATPPLISDWPASPERPDRGYLHITHIEALAASAILGWLMYCVTFPNRGLPDTSEGLYFFYRLISGVLIIGRFLIYWFDHWPPISLFGRFATKRWLIPGYDKLFVAPLVVAIAFLALPRLCEVLGIQPHVAVPISTAVVVWLALALPPSWEKWHFTGHHRSTLTKIENRQTIRT